MSRWQVGAAALNSDPTSPWCGEPALYELAAPGRAPLVLHPSRVVCFLGNPLPDPWTTPSTWSDSVLQALDDAVHAAAPTTAGATSLMQTRRYTIGNQIFQLDKPGMQHILERHAPDDWNGSEGQTQTFLPRKMRIGEIQDIVGDVRGKNRDGIIADPDRCGWKLLGTGKGTRHNMTTYKGRITCLVPLP